MVNARFAHREPSAKDLLRQRKIFHFVQDRPLKLES